MIRNFRLLVMTILALAPMLAAASPSGTDAEALAVGIADWQGAPPAAGDRADAYADLALSDGSAAALDGWLVDFALVSVTEPSIAALLSTAIIWLLAIYWRLRREHKRSEHRRRARRDRPHKPALPGA